MIELSFKLAAKVTPVTKAERGIPRTMPLGADLTDGRGQSILGSLSCSDGIMSLTALAPRSLRCSPTAHTKTSEREMSDIELARLTPGSRDPAIQAVFSQRRRCSSSSSSISNNKSNGWMVQQQGQLQHG
jgi:hypothetical protein